MLDTNTKRRIDTARDILVGKVPDPKSQVEQITIALIYKFMDDMDAESEELGGKRTFFANGFSRYSWAKLMRSGLGGHETLNLYAEAITKMPENPGIPVLFRSIFKNAYLPYRDPETLKSFLKVIDEFEYDHSERLGDAFEYLLSVLGSQGDAGQFRTPRHIIDFMVKIIDPKKHEKILDPACGTAGFLISSYKHIKDANKEIPLTPDETGALAANIKGYDISPDMVRLSLVNMYLHGFNDPHIEEYDTLSSQDKWNEYADVILANPPFMSPKGGIKPHKRFSVQSKRSEVLFVDYMAEHLTPTGRAAIIVPEGIIFQSGTAYKQLRKMLVENSLVAVISLPAGVFQPYSGVKTSILILDKSLAKQSQHIVFFKVENDGFGLGAQRRPIEKNDLPTIKEEVEKFLQALRNRDDVEELGLSTGRAVLKDKVAENGEYNLSGERYRQGKALLSAFPFQRFEQVCTLEYGASLPKKKRISGPYPVVGSNGITGYHNEYLIEGPAIIVGRKGSAGEITWLEQNCFPIDTTYYVKQTNPETSDIRFLYWLLKTLNLPKLRGGAGIPGLNRTDVYRTHKIPLPPLEVQQEIVTEIEGYQKVIDGARAVIDNYKPQIHIDPEWEMVELGKFARLINGRAYKKKELLHAGPTPVLRVGNFFSNREWYYSDLELSDEKYCNKGDLLYAWSASFGPRIWDGPRAIYHYHIWKVETTSHIDKLFLFHLLAKDSEKIKSEGHGIAMMHTTKSSMEKRKFPLPPIETQQAIVAEIEAEQALVNANRELIERFEKKIQATIALVWGEDKTESES